MNPVTPPLSALQRARARVRRAALRRRLEAVAEGKSDDATLPRDDALDADSVLAAVASGLDPDGAPMQRLIACLVNAGAIDQIVDSLESASPHQRVAAIRALGAVRMYEAVSWVAPLLAAPERPVRDAAARMLGQVGGAQSASALLGAIYRGGFRRRLVLELARSAPDHFVESAMSQPFRRAARPALALASGLRRRRTAAGPLMTLVSRGSRRERLIGCRALGWIGAASAAPVIAEALNDRDWKIRMSAAKALGRLRADGARAELLHLEADRNPRVRLAASAALRRIGAGGTRQGAAVGA
jgi:HEAT repeat protein